jgi:hypothetical protein
MNTESIEKFSQSKGLEIAQILTEEYDSADFEINSREIEREIYDVATSYSRILFFESKKFLQESVREDIKSHLASRFDPKKVKEMKDVDLIAHWIKSETIKTLEHKKIFLT